MKKLLLFALGAMMAFPVMAQDEIGDDVTKYVINAGFDEDLTFQTDGTMKEAVSTTTSLSDRSWAYIAADSTVYARPKSTSGQSRPDGRKLEAVNGFIGRVQGWTIETNQTFPKCEWVYFGTVPYDLADKAVPIADDGQTYLEVPARPEAVEGENTAFAYLRAGWGGRAVYKQVVKLPCAKYELTYWAININPSATNGTNLSKVTCRKDVWADETGFNDTEWTQHRIEFTPTSEFTIEFGFESSGGSGSNPFLCIDGIKLVKIDDADEVDVRQSDNYDLFYEIQAIMTDSLSDYQGIVAEWDEMNIQWEEEYCAVTDIDALIAGEAALKALKAKYLQAMEDVKALSEKISDCENFIYDNKFPGEDVFQAAIDNAANALDNGTADEIAAALKELDMALVTYIISQEGITEDNPANLTAAFVQHPWFVEKDGEPDENGVFPHEYEYGYTQGSAPQDGTSEGWYIGESGGDQRLNFVAGKTCWNAWNNNFTSVSINQDITNLPQGFYKVSAEMVTQDEMFTDQHVFVKGMMGTKNSPVLNPENCSWDGYLWETLTSEALVVPENGTITIGAWGTGSSTTGAAGWFCATNFKLLYCGPATDEQVAEALAARVAEVNGAIETMHFAADKADAKAIMAEYEASQDIEKLTEAAALAETSENKYNEIMQEGKTIPTVEAGLADGTYADAAPIAQFALDYVKAWLASEEATYTEVDNQLNLVKNYVNTYITAYQQAAEVLANTTNESAKGFLSSLMASQKEQLISEMKDADTVNAFVEELKTLVYNVEKQNMYDSDPDATDYTSFIQNPKAEAETGWTFDKGVGNGPINSGEYFDSNDSGHRYFDSYNSEVGVLNFYGEQVIEGLPNGTYAMKAAVRSNGEHLFLFAANGGEAKSDTTWHEVAIQLYTHVDEETGEEVTDTCTNYWGEIWEDATEVFVDMRSDDPDYYYYQGICNAHSGEGFGWKWDSIEGIEVKDHKLVIGFTTDGARTGSQFTGTWFSVTDFSLTLTSKGDNTGWEGPFATGINEVNAETKAADGIYTISGVRSNSLQKGLNIVVRNGQATKVLVK
ncbi:MAG: hypothetical protein K6C10_01475 [Prevotella sp.]|nr:hypothetical protein [Prevotella sp.]